MSFGTLGVIGGGGIPSTVNLGGGVSVPFQSVVSHYRAGQALPYFDTFERASNGWALNSAGVLIEYDDNLIRVGPQGAWVEGARTNLFANTVFAGAAAPLTPPTSWAHPGGGTGTSTPQASVIFPTANALRQQATAQRPYIISLVARDLAAVAYTFSAFVEAVVTTNTQRIFLTSGANVNFEGPLINAISAPSRVSDSKLQGETSTNIQQRIGGGAAANTTTDLTFSLPQFEQAPFVSTPIANTNADTSMTRAEEIWTTTLIPGAELIVRARGVTAPGLEGRQILAQADDGTEGDRLTIVRDADGDILVELFVGGVEQAVLNLGAVANSTELDVLASFGYDTDLATNVATGRLGTAPIDALSATGVDLPSVTIGRTGHGSASGSRWFGTVAERVWAIA